MLTPENVALAAELLLGARRTGQPIDALPSGCRPSDAEEAYAIQDRVTRELGGAGGWKVGARDPGSLPSCAPLPAALVFRAPHAFRAGSFRLNGIEAELAFTFAHDLPARAAPYTEADVLGAIASIHPVFEIVDSRFVDLKATDPLSQLADSGSNGALVVGAAGPGPIRIDQTRQPVTLRHNGAEVFSVTGGNTAGDVFRLLVWLANHVASRTGGLRAGQVVTTGSCTGIRFAAAGDRLRADFPGVGSVEFAFG